MERQRAIGDVSILRPLVVGRMHAIGGSLGRKNPGYIGRIMTWDNVTAPHRSGRSALEDLQDLVAPMIIRGSGHPS